MTEPGTAPNDSYRRKESGPVSTVAIHLQPEVMIVRPLGWHRAASLERSIDIPITSIVGVGRDRQAIENGPVGL